MLALRLVEMDASEIAALKIAMGDCAVLCVDFMRRKHCMCLLRNVVRKPQKGETKRMHA